MANISLLGSITSCRVDQAEAARIESARFQDPSLMVCPTWNGFNLKGQKVCPDSFMTKTAGCNTSMDRVAVENSLRPQYAEYINLDSQGYMSNQMYANNMNFVNVGHQQAAVDQVQATQPNFGLQFGANTEVGCAPQYSQAMAQLGHANRNSQQMNLGNQSHQMRQSSGMGGM